MSSHFRLVQAFDWPLKDSVLLTGTYIDLRLANRFKGYPG